ncbi:hypothetical protein AB0C76_32955 [Kitasatospora sp. NPDC048722]
MAQSPHIPNPPSAPRSWSEFGEPRGAALLDDLVHIGGVGEAVWE